MSTLRYSILIPVFNVERYIDECLKSVIYQTYQDFEVIIIDDGSTDSSGKICDNYAKKDSRIKVYHQDNQGLMLSRKNGILKATGDYCLFLDSDDYYDFTLLSEVDSYIETYNLDMLIFNKREVYRDGKIKESIKLFDKEFAVVDSEEMLRLMVGTYKYNSVVNKVVRREMVVPYVDDIYVKINYTEDMLQSVNFIIHSEKIGILNKSLYNYRINNSSLVHNMSMEHIVEAIEIEDRIRKIIEENINVSEKEMLPFYSNAVNNIMDCLYRLNNISGLSVSEHVKCMRKVVGNETVNKYIKMSDSSRVALYNRIRLVMVRKELFIPLLIVDKLILIVQDITNILKNEKKFD